LIIPTNLLREYGAAIELNQILSSNDTLAFLVIQDDTILYERYFQGHTSATLSQSFSMAKSFSSVLIGLAIDDGYIAGVDQSITDFVPELASEGFDKVEIYHLLSMTSGSNYMENDNPFGEHVILNYTPQLEKEILKFKMESTPGEEFRYKSGDNALLALALDRALGEETITEYTQRRLWTPLGMENVGIWTLDHEGDGLEKTWCCLSATARDFAKLGRLYLDQGSWNGEQILSSDWIEQSITGQISGTAWPQAFADIGWRNYGYYWWLASEDQEDYFALGKDGQILYINPHQDLIILRLGWSTGELSSYQWIALFQSLAELTG
jgi:CubicO group peptidase (beta-lactamase class C family)